MHEGDSDRYGKITALSIDGTSVTVGNTTVIENVICIDACAVRLSDTKALVTYLNHTDKPVSQLNGKYAIASLQHGSASVVNVDTVGVYSDVATNEACPAIISNNLCFIGYNLPLDGNKLAAKFFSLT